MNAKPNVIFETDSMNPYVLIASGFKFITAMEDFLCEVNW
jgi:hypothetical protein